LLVCSLAAGLAVYLPARLLIDLPAHLPARFNRISSNLSSVGPLACRSVWRSVYSALDLSGCRSGYRLGCPQAFTWRQAGCLSVYRSGVYLSVLCILLQAA
jgi:hypothetical protein